MAAGPDQRIAWALAMAFGLVACADLVGLKQSTYLPLVDGGVDAQGGSGARSDGGGDGQGAGDASKPESGRSGGSGQGASGAPSGGSGASDGGSGSTSGVGGSGPSGSTGSTGHAGASGSSEDGGVSGSTEDAGSSGASGSSGTEPDARIPNTPGQGYVVTDRWHGQAFVDKSPDVTLEPENFADVDADDPLCIKGVIPKNQRGDGYALLGVYLNQDKAPGSPPKLVKPSAEKLAVLVTNPNQASIRVELAASVGDFQERWCEYLNGGTAAAFDYAAELQTTCWEADGSPYRFDPVSEIRLIVEGSTEWDVPFDFCLVAFGDGQAARN